MLKVLRGGMLSTVQDGGRLGYQALGVTPGGAMDDVALRLGNWIVGNAGTAAVIEMTWTGAVFEIAQDMLIALTGGTAEIRCNAAPVPQWRPVWIRKGSVLQVGRIRLGARVYLCVQGGVITPMVMGSLGTDLRNRFGGYDGRALQTGDVIRTHPQPHRYPRMVAQRSLQQKGFVSVPWQVSLRRDYTLTLATPMQLLAGPQQSALGSQGVQALYTAAFQVLPHSDRQGVRLQGQTLHVEHCQVSAGVCFGVLQLPPDGNPILLLADHQTTGGYPVIGVVASVARARLAQVKPGDQVSFVPCSLEQAHATLLAREKRLAAIRRELEWRAKTC